MKEDEGFRGSLMTEVAWVDRVELTAEKGIVGLEGREMLLSGLRTGTVMLRLMLDRHLGDTEWEESFSLIKWAEWI